MLSPSWYSQNVSEAFAGLFAPLLTTSEALAAHVVIGAAITAASETVQNNLAVADVAESNSWLSGFVIALNDDFHAISPARSVASALV